MLKKITLLILILLFVFCGNSFAQLKKTLHQTIDLSRSVAVKLDLTGDYELVHWAGNHFLIETNIALYDATKHLLDHLVKHGRYEVTTNIEGQQANIEWNDKERRRIQYKQKECYEEAKVKLYVPDFFEIINANTLINNKIKDEFPEVAAAAIAPPKEDESEEEVEITEDGN